MRHSFLLIFTALALTACQPDNAQQGAGGFPGMGGPPPKVTAIKPEQRDVHEQDDFTGRFEAVDKTDIRPRVGGYLRAIHFKDGQMVKKGDLLFTIDPKPYQADMQQAGANVKLAQTQLTLAEQQLARAADLLSTGDVSKTFYDERQQARDAAAEAVRAAQAQQNAVGLNLGYADVRAPISGRISRSLVDVGNLVAGDQAGQPTLLTSIVTLDPIYFYFNVDEKTYLKYARANQQKTETVLNIALADDADFTLQGVLDFVDTSLDPNSATMQARALVKNTDGLVVPGLFGRAQLENATSYTAILVPADAIVTDQTRKMVMTVGADGTVAPALVELGVIVDGMQVVKSGLTGNELVIVRGLQRAIPGMKVDPQTQQ